MSVANDLNLDVFCPPDIPLEENRVVAEGRPGFLAGLLELLSEVRLGIDHTHAATAAPKGRFDDEWKSDFCCNLLRFRAFGANGVLRAGHDWDTCPLSDLSRGSLIAQSIQNFSTGSDKSYASALTSPRQRRVLGKEPISRMNRIHFLFHRQGDYRIHVQVGLNRTFPLTNQVSFVRLKPM